MLSQFVLQPSHELQLEVRFVSNILLTHSLGQRLLVKIRRTLRRLTLNDVAMFGCLQRGFSRNKRHGSLTSEVLEFLFDNFSHK